jgi:hypothetical protein
MIKKILYIKKEYESTRKINPLIDCFRAWFC